MKENQASSAHIIEMAKIMSAAAIRRRRRHLWRRNGGNVGQWLKRCQLMTVEKWRNRNIENNGIISA
jgi:hypothetical protein